MKSAAKLPVADWTTQEWLYFLNGLPRDLGVKRMAELDRAFHLTASGNNEIVHSWLLLAIANDYVSAHARLRDYLVSIGRRKLIVPLYEALLETASGRAMATSIYAVARPGYHPLAQGTVDDLLQAESAMIHDLANWYDLCLFPPPQPSPARRGGSITHDALPGLISRL